MKLDKGMNNENSQSESWVHGHSLSSNLESVIDNVSPYHSGPAWTNHENQCSFVLFTLQFPEKIKYTDIQKKHLHWYKQEQMLQILAIEHCPKELSNAFYFKILKDTSERIEMWPHCWKFTNKSCIIHCMHHTVYMIVICFKV